MPRGDWRKINHFTHGPEKTKKAINGELVDPLQDALDRICALEDEADQSTTADGGNLRAIVVVDGIVRYATITGTVGDIIAN